MIFITRRLKNRYLQIFDFYCFRFMHGQASIEVKMRWDFSFFFFSFFLEKVLRRGRNKRVKREIESNGDRR